MRHRSLATRVLLVWTALVGPLAGCAPSIATVGEQGDTAIWLRGEGDTTIDTRAVGHAFVLSSLDDFCDRYVERWRGHHAAWSELQETLSLLPEGPSQDRCEARKRYWVQRYEAEEQLYWQEARHTVLFRYLLEDEDEDGWPEETGRVEVGDIPIFVEPAGFYISSLRARSTAVAKPDPLGDCSSALAQEAAEEHVDYLGPPREEWLVPEGLVTVSIVEDRTVRLAVADASFDFSREVSYRLPGSEVVEDEEPRDPVPLSFDRDFERCDITVEENWWLNLFFWAAGGY